MASKHHHYVPQTYLKAFCNAAGKLCVYRKDEPTRFFYQAPENTGFRKYYYSQPTPEGGRDDDRLERVFSETESRWPAIVERLCNRDNVNAQLEDVFAFITLQRVRVPAARDAIEAILAETVKAYAKTLDALGEFPPQPSGFEDILEHVEVAIDPHQSIHAMVDMMQATGRVLDRLGLCALHHTTSVPFLTSDNPVIWFDSGLPENHVRPYGVRPAGEITFLFPVTPNVIIYGHSSYREVFASQGLWHRELNELNWVELMNRRIAQFAYEVVFAAGPGHEALITEYAHLSPVVYTTTIAREHREFLHHQFVWGRRQRKPKWESRRA